jgi:hypothetical protein
MDDLIPTGRPEGDVSVGNPGCHPEGIYAVVGDILMADMRYEMRDTGCAK